MSLGAESLPGWRGQTRHDGQTDAQPDGQTDAQTDGHSPAEDSPQEDAEDQQAQTGSQSTTGGGKENEPVVVWQAESHLEAEIVKGRLESEGIPAFLSGEALGTIYGLTTGNLAATSVLVPGTLADKAVDILNTSVEWDDEAWVDAAGDGNAGDGDAADKDEWNA